jgi:hypothetical protein
MTSDTKLPTSPSTVPAGHGSLDPLVRPFVVIDPYQYEGDVAFGVWDEKHCGYLLGDGDLYRCEELINVWGSAATLLTWSELEARLKRPNGESSDRSERFAEPKGSTL